MLAAWPIRLVLDQRNIPRTSPIATALALLYLAKTKRVLTTMDRGEQLTDFLEICCGGKPSFQDLQAVEDILKELIGQQAARI